MGVVFNPFTGQLYHAIRGQGAYLDDSKPGSALPRVRKLPFRDPPEPLRGLNRALVAIEWGNERHGNNWEVKIATLATLAKAKQSGGAMVHSLRSLGSAALNLCGVATGSLDAYWEGGCWAWDVAAGWVILEEAGGIMVGANKGDWKPKVDGRQYLAIRAGDSDKQKEMVEEFWGYVKGRLEFAV